MSKSIRTIIVISFSLLAAKNRLGSDYNSTNQNQSGSDLSAATTNAFCDEYFLKTFEIKPISDQPSLGAFDDDMSNLRNLFDPLSGSDQSLSFYRKALLVASRYRHSFPIGRIRDRILSEIHVTKDCPRRLGDYLEKTNCSRYEAMGSVLLKKSEILGASVQEKDIEKSKELLFLSLVLMTESKFELSAAFEEVARESKKSKACKEFISTHKTKFLEDRKKQYLSADKMVFLLGGNFYKTIDEMTAKTALEKHAMKPSELLKLRESAAAYESLIFNTPGCLDAQYGYVRSLCCLKQVARKGKDSVFLNTISDRLNEIKNKKYSAFSSRIADEARLIDEINAPRRFYLGTMVMDIKGEIIGVDEDGDGKPDHIYDPKDYE